MHLKVWIWCWLDRFSIVPEPGRICQEVKESRHFPPELLNNSCPLTSCYNLMCVEDLQRSGVTWGLLMVKPRGRRNRWEAKRLIRSVCYSESLWLVLHDQLNTWRFTAIRWAETGQKWRRRGKWTALPVISVPWGSLCTARQGRGAPIHCASEQVAYSLQGR